MTRLRKMMLEELQRRNYSAITTRNYLRVVSDFAKHFGKSPDKLGPNELRTYQAYLLTECKLTPGTVVNRVAALRFFFVKTLKRHQFREFLPYPRARRRLPTGAQPRGGCAIDRCGGNTLSTNAADDALRHRHAT
ncbi:MAG: site-specific integrase [Candidatus Sulfotelmatobacter sp.]